MDDRHATKQNYLNQNITMKNSENKNEITVDVYTQIINTYPEISADGYEPDTNSVKYPKNRKDLYDHLGAFNACVHWLSTNSIPRTKSTSYGLKSLVEKAEDVYVPNGVFILAVLHVGYQLTGYIKETPSVIFSKDRNPKWINAPIGKIRGIKQK